MVAGVEAWPAALVGGAVCLAAGMGLPLLGVIAFLVLFFGTIWGFVTLKYDFLGSTILFGVSEGLWWVTLRVLERFLVMRFLAFL